METIGALASGIAHNFNNIVGAILGYTEMGKHSWLLTTGRRTTSVRSGAPQSAHATLSIRSSLSAGAGMCSAGR
jgi:hypothetical protein